MTERVLNFGPGPSMLPAEVWEEARESLLSFAGTGIGIAELSHRSAEFEAVQADAEARLRRLLGLDDDWAVLFLQGGASTQFLMVPMNFGPRGAYVVTGTWSQKALKEAAILGSPHVAATSEATGFDRIPPAFDVPTDAGYLHITSNNTIFGTQWQNVPDVSVPLVCDASSDILSRALATDRFDLVYAGAQKNLGIAGVTVVFLRRSLLERIPAGLPSMLDYRTHVSKNSAFNTSPTFGIYIVSLMAKWIEEQGGVETLGERNEAKAARLYEVIDGHALYEGHAVPDSRSRMNVTFRIGDPELETAFLAEAKANGMVGLKGHRSVGGIRASIYNAMPLDGVERLAAFMESFATQTV